MRHHQAHQNKEIMKIYRKRNGILHACSTDDDPPPGGQLYDIILPPDLQPRNGEIFCRKCNEFSLSYHATEDSWKTKETHLRAVLRHEAAGCGVVDVKGRCVVVGDDAVCRFCGVFSRRLANLAGKERNKVAAAILRHERSCRANPDNHRPMNPTLQRILGVKPREPPSSNVSSSENIIGASF